MSFANDASSQLEVIEFGPPDSLKYRCILQQCGSVISPYHFIPLHPSSSPSEVSFVCTSTAGHSIRHEVAFDEPFTPLRVAKAVDGVVAQYASPAPWNCGVLPQTHRPFKISGAATPTSKHGSGRNGWTSPSSTQTDLERSHLESSSRGRLGTRLSLGVRALDLFVTCKTGQRVGVFAGSGVGKSTLLSMLARQAQCDVAVVALVGERGREVREFIEDDLGAAGLARSVVVVATSDQPPLLRREAAYAAMTIAEHFRDRGQSVLLLMDSVTRFCLALREIALSAGEPPAMRGYPPSVFAELPRLLERAGPGAGRADGRPPGQITGLFTVLVEGDDMNEPVADAVRGILDGHIVLDRRIAEGGQYPAVDILQSLSRTVPQCLTGAEAALVRTARNALATAAELSDLVRLGAYVSGADPAADEALRLAPRIVDVLRQGRNEAATLDGAFVALASALDAAPVG